MPSKCRQVDPGVAAPGHAVGSQEADPRGVEGDALEAIVRLAREGDRAAGETLYRMHVGYVAGMVLRLLANRSETEDVVQDTFVIALRELARLRNPLAVRSWLCQIAVNEVRHRLRKRRLMRLLGLRPASDAVDFESIAAPGASAETHADLAVLGRVLGSLPAHQRIAWSLRYVDGESLEQVAVICNCSLATAKRRISAAHKRVCEDLHAGAARLPAVTWTPPEGA